MEFSNLYIIVFLFVLDAIVHAHVIHVLRLCIRYYGNDAIQDYSVFANCFFNCGSGEGGGELLSKGKYDLTVLYTCMLNIQNELFVFQEKVYI